MAKHKGAFCLSHEFMHADACMKVNTPVNHVISYCWTTESVLLLTYALQAMLCSLQVIGMESVTGKIWVSHKSALETSVLFIVLLSSTLSEFSAPTAGVGSGLVVVVVVVGSPTFTRETGMVLSSSWAAGSAVAAPGQRGEHVCNVNVRSLSAWSLHFYALYSQFWT